ncbi:MAG: type II toxin-antitoxin system VapC family toxin [Clostridiales Family XIII bacterium]|jgi:predicted nucleic acid-binding protein|nr:type II toxin-antitoxin system VapC family toxin [Clostridiales Family XIII bacterium]
MNDCYVLDACAVLAQLAGEEGADVVTGLIAKAEIDGYRVLMHKANLCEVYYDLARSRNEAAADEFLNTFSGLPITIVDSISDALLKKISEYKVSYRISFADSFALATAFLHDAVVVTSDHHEFDIIEQAGKLQFYWIR